MLLQCLFMRSERLYFFGFTPKYLDHLLLAPRFDAKAGRLLYPGYDIEGHRFGAPAGTVFFFGYGETDEDRAATLTRAKNAYPDRHTYVVTTLSKAQIEVLRAGEGSFYQWSPDPSSPPTKLLLAYGSYDVLKRLLSVVPGNESVPCRPVIGRN